MRVLSCNVALQSFFAISSAKAILKHLPLAGEKELVDAESNLVVSVQVLRVPVVQVNAGLGELGELIDDQAHLNVRVTCE